MVNGTSPFAADYDLTNIIAAYRDRNGKPDYTAANCSIAVVSILVVALRGFKFCIKTENPINLDVFFPHFSDDSFFRSQPCLDDWKSSRYTIHH